MSARWATRHLCVFGPPPPPPPPPPHTHTHTPHTTHSALLFRRADAMAAALILDAGPTGSIARGVGVTVALRAILQVVDPSSGPSTKREYEVATVPVGDGAAGRIVSAAGVAVDGRGGDADTPGAGVTAPLLAGAPPMDARDPISEPLTTGVKGIDTLTPVGRGQCLLVLGAPGAGKTTACVDAAVTAARAGVRVVYAATGGADADAVAAALARADALGASTIVAAPRGANAGQRFAAVCAAAALAERARDEGRPSLLIVDDGACAVDVWEATAGALPPSDDAAENAATAAAAAATIATFDGDTEALVEYEGMLVSAAAAARRRFIASLLQRTAKLSTRNGGGSLTALIVLPGVPATGDRPVRAVDPASLTTLTEEQRAKLAAALAKRSGAGGAGAGEAPTAATQTTSTLRTEAVEEFMSIADGQAVLVRASPSSPPSVDPSSSVSRIGGRAYPPALRDRAPAVRLALAQAADDARYGGASPGAAARIARAERVRAALAQPPGWPVGVDELAVTLAALDAGFVDGAPVDAVPRRVALLVTHVRRAAPDILDRLAAGTSTEGDATALAAAMAEVGGRLAEAGAGVERREG